MTSVKTDTAQQFQISPGPGIVATVHVNPSATISYTDAGGNKVSGKQNASVGSLTGTNGAALLFTVHSADGYADGHISITYGKDSESAHCAVNFNLGKTTPWDISPSANNDPSILTYSSGAPTNIAISKPTGNVPSGISSTCQPLNKSMVFAVDLNKTGNMVFRGNCPLAAATTNWGPQRIDYETIHSFLAMRFQEEVGEAFYDIGSYVFCDVNLQSPVSETQYLQYEIDSMGGSNIASLDNQAWYPATGAYQDPTSGMLCRMVNYSINPDVTPESAIDDFDQSCATHLNTWMNATNEDGLPYVYYVHCASGHDRTGIICSTYLMMQHPDYSLDEAFVRGTTVHKLLAGTGQLQPDCNYINGPKAGDESSKFSRIMLIANSYNVTVENIYNELKGNAKKDHNWATLDAGSTQENPALVYDDYPWTKEFTPSAP